MIGVDELLDGPLEPLFEEYVISQRCEEHLHFFRKARQYQLTADIESRKQLAEQIWNEFFLSTSDNFISYSSIVQQGMWKVCSLLLGCLIDLLRMPSHVS
jgi:hypothetical protein